MTEEDDTKQKEAIKLLSDRAQVFQNNEAFAQGDPSSGAKDQPVYIASKKVKMNEFNVSCVCTFINV